MTKGTHVPCYRSYTGLSLVSVLNKQLGVVANFII